MPKQDPVTGSRYTGHGYDDRDNERSKPVVKTRKLPNGDTLRATVYNSGANSITIDGKTFSVGDKLDEHRTITAITEDKVQLTDDSANVRGMNNRKWYKKNSKILVDIKRKGD